VRMLIKKALVLKDRDLAGCQGAFDSESESGAVSRPTFAAGKESSQRDMAEVDATGCSQHCSLKARPKNEGGWTFIDRVLRTLKYSATQISVNSQENLTVIFIEDPRWRCDDLSDFA